MNHILCFGDSLTYGQIPSDTELKSRYDESVRWTGILQAQCGSDTKIIEEGLPSRTIDKDDPRPGKEGRNGAQYLYPCVSSHLPLEVIIIWLGTNDTKDLFEKSAEEIAQSMEQMIVKLQTVLKEQNSPAKIILMSPPQLNTANPICNEMYSTAPPKLALLKELYKSLAGYLGTEFLDMHDRLGVPDTKDGIHLSEAQNLIVAEAVFTKLKDLGMDLQ
jgi:lysophospholipase L1-like esterase